MSIVVIDQQVVHYEVMGRGRPVLFLHGWMGSWRYWFPTMQRMSRRFRTYSFDFWGFGDSRRQTMTESVQAYSNQVIRFMNELGIDWVMLVGHSMGGMVALRTAIKHPDRIARVAAIGAPIVGHSLSWLLKLTSHPRLADTFARMPRFRRWMFRRFLGTPGDPAHEEIVDDSVKSTSTTLHRTINSMLRTDLRHELPRLQVPALIVHGGRDNVVNPNQVDLFDEVDLARVVVMPKSQHFPFLDEADLFDDLLFGFLDEEPSRPNLNGQAVVRPVAG